MLNEAILNHFQVVFKVVCNNTFDAYAVVNYQNGKTAKGEFYYGDLFLSQCGRFMMVNGSMHQKQ